MWILLKESFAGRLNGQAYNLVGGSKYDLPEPAVKQLREELAKKAKQLRKEPDKNAVVNTCAPWDEHVDPKAAKRNAFTAKVKAAINKARNLTAEFNQLAVSIEKMGEEYAQKSQELDNAVKEAKKLAKAAGIEWPPKDAG